jgi:hypothetical protein
MQQLLRAAGRQTGQEAASALEQEQWGELLTNPYKMQAYQLQLRSLVQQGSPDASHLRLLLFLLGQLERSSPEVSYREEELRLEFNGRALREQEAELAVLQGEKEDMRREMQEIGRAYENILLNFNAVIDKLVHKQSQPPS